MKNRAPKAVVTNAAALEWIEIERENSCLKNDAAGLLEVRIGSCIVRVSPGFDKPLFTEVCKALLSL